jgi:hypothetical protein
MLQKRCRIQTDDATCMISVEVYEAESYFPDVMTVEHRRLAAQVQLVTQSFGIPYGLPRISHQ